MGFKREVTNNFGSLVDCWTLTHPTLGFRLQPEDAAVRNDTVAMHNAGSHHGMHCFTLNDTKAYYYNRRLVCSVLTYAR